MMEVYVDDMITKDVKEIDHVKYLEENSCQTYRKDDGGICG